MSDLALNVTWKKILKETEEGNIPHCRALSAPEKWHTQILETLAKIILEDPNIDLKIGHPDLIIIGSFEKAPGIASCRNLIQDIALKPLKSQKRLGVVLSSGKLLLPAANSLLKLAEEPPSHAFLLFLMDDSKFFLSTLKSRSRFNILLSNDDEDEIEIKSMPLNESEWIEWLENARKNEIIEIEKNLESWALYEISKKNFLISEKIYKLKILASEKNLSVPMMCDLIILALKESDIYFERLFNDIR